MMEDYNPTSRTGYDAEPPWVPQSRGPVRPPFRNLPLHLSPLRLEH